MAGVNRRRLVCGGAVQGVGFRPAVYRLANELHLAGWVRNDAHGATIEIEGGEAQLSAFVSRLPAALPPLARLDALVVTEMTPLGETVFAVGRSDSAARRGALVPPDAAVCPACRADMADPDDRRHHYPFTTCTDCGPRFSLVRTLPYDRERTTMACFPLCAACRGEYEDPADRRFHAEPIACPACGPRLWLDAPGSWDHLSASLRARRGAAMDAIQQARDALARGAIVAIKGMGGFQLACNASDPAAVARLRTRKHRPAKPFALMVGDLASARRLVRLDGTDEELLASARAPVLLAPRRDDAPVAPDVAPGVVDLGVMLPTTPLHVELLLDDRFSALVMTSGNASDEPICRANREALERLTGIADVFLLHDRDIARRADDSVARTDPGGPFLVRRARGWVPEPLPLPEEAVRPTLALGPHLQVTACLATGEAAFPSQHVGDLDTEGARAFLEEAAAGLEDFLQVRAEVIAVDLHADYASTWLGERLARERGARLVRLQHHLAHAAATLAEHTAFPAPGERAMALVLDGTGWGHDGVAWGGEWLVLDGRLRWTRPAHLTPLPLVGGEAAVRQPWRVLAAALAGEGAASLLARLPVANVVPAGSLALVASLAGRGGWPFATGAGRLFEAAGAMLGLAAENSYEGESAARLESLAASAPPCEPWGEVAVDRTVTLPRLPGAALLAAAARRLAGGAAAVDVAAGFHATFARLAVEITAEIAPNGTRTVALGGGCLVNRILRARLTEGLRAVGLDPLVPRRVPPGDGGVSYGQAVLAAVGLARAVEPTFEGGC